MQQHDHIPAAGVLCAVVNPSSHRTATSSQTLSKPAIHHHTRMMKPGSRLAEAREVYGQRSISVCSAKMASRAPYELLMRNCLKRSRLHGHHNADLRTDVLTELLFSKDDRIYARRDFNDYGDVAFACAQLARLCAARKSDPELRGLRPGRISPRGAKHGVGRRSTRNFGIRADDFGSAETL